MDGWVDTFMGVGSYQPFDTNYILLRNFYFCEGKYKMFLEYSRMSYFST
jgi:hypothetical protein